jgi:hypothetical protein
MPNWLEISVNDSIVLGDPEAEWRFVTLPGCCVPQTRFAQLNGAPGSSPRRWLRWRASPENWRAFLDTYRNQVCCAVPRSSRATGKNPEHVSCRVGRSQPPSFFTKPSPAGGDDMAKIRLFVISVALLPLLACSNSPNYDTQDDSTCRKSSDPGSEQYRLCRQAIAQKREAESRTLRTIIESPSLQPSFIDRR